MQQTLNYTKLDPDDKATYPPHDVKTPLWLAVGEALPVLGYLRFVEVGRNLIFYRLAEPGSDIALLQFEQPIKREVCGWALAQETPKPLQFEQPENKLNLRCPKCEILCRIVLTGVKSHRCRTMIGVSAQIVCPMCGVGGPICANINEARKEFSETFHGGKHD